MRPKRRRPVYYTAISMNDGTVLAAYPVRKPAERIMKRGGDRLDIDGVCKEFTGSRVNSYRNDDPGRLRFFDIMANRLNTRRAIHELVEPQLDSLRSEVADLKAQVSELVTLLTKQQGQ